MAELTTDDTTLPLIADPANYLACQWDLCELPDKRRHWIDVFRRHFPSLLEQACRVEEHDGKDAADAEQRATWAKETFFAELDRMETEPERFTRFDILTICYARERVLREAGFDDPYRLAKAKENDAAIKLLPDVLAELDAMDPAERAVAVVKGMFAGNIFDLGATSTAERFQNEQVDFRATLAQLPDRPWVVDDLDPWLDRLRAGEAHERALMFVDNAGPDVVLGMIPFARYLLQRGTNVIITANTEPSLNDVTHDELGELLEQVAEVDGVIRGAMAAGRLETAPSGNNAPLIDLTRVSPELVAKVGEAGVDLLVLEGMGRALESNFFARFNCETIKVAMIKDRGVAESLGGELYDVVFRYETPEG
ncbi:MAG: ARMT1-like domain-containing protein [Phycisphaeraceae bacterium]